MRKRKKPVKVIQGSIWFDANEEHPADLKLWLFDWGREHGFPRFNLKIPNTMMDIGILLYDEESWRFVLTDHPTNSPSVLQHAFSQITASS
jgi:hypothetical protein